MMSVFIVLAIYIATTVSEKCSTGEDCPGPKCCVDMGNGLSEFKPLANEDAPELIFIDGTEEAKPGGVINMTCKTYITNPASEVTWVIDGLSMQSNSQVTQEENGRMVTSSTISVNVTEQDHNSKTFTCYILDQDIGETIAKSFTVNILYAPDKPAIFGYEEGTAIDAGKQLKLTCISHGGNPLPELKWFKREEELSGSQTSTTETIISKELTIVTVPNDNGAIYQCRSSNKALSQPLVSSITLTVYHEPLIKDLDTYKTIVSDRKQSAELQCKAEGIPDVAFSWFFEGLNVSKKKSRIKNETTKLDNFLWKSVLTIEVVSVEDFGEYKCVARNEKGFDTAQIPLIPDGVPDPPVFLKVSNITRNSIFLTWIPGFDGGHNQTYRVRYKSFSSPTFTYIDVLPPSSNSVWIENLKSGTKHEIAMMSLNEKGSSPYTAENIKVTTLGLPDIALKSGEKFLATGNTMEILAFSLGIGFFLLLVVNITLLVVLCRKKKTTKSDVPYCSTIKVSEGI